MAGTNVICDGPGDEFAQRKNLWKRGVVSSSSCAGIGGGVALCLEVLDFSVPNVVLSSDLGAHTSSKEPLMRELPEGRLACPWWYWKDASYLGGGDIGRG